MTEKTLTIECPETGMTRRQILIAAFGPGVLVNLTFTGMAAPEQVLHPGDTHTHTDTVNKVEYTIELVPEKDDGLDTTFFWQPRKNRVRA